MLREESGTVRVAEPGERQGRHGRPKPVGARFRLPGFRFSGAAMAMSTVVGISVATTWLVSQQQQVGRPPRVSSVGASPPAPSPDAVPQQAAGHPATPEPTATTAVPTARTSQPPARPVTAGPSPARSSAAPSPTTGAPLPAGSPAASGPAEPSTAPTLGPVPGRIPTQPPIAAAPPDGVPVAKAPEVLTGLAERRPLGLSGTRHTLELKVASAVTALLVEFRLERPTALPGTLPWSNLPGTVVTVLQDRGTVIYRFTLAPGLDVEPGTYVFAVHGAASPVDPPVTRQVPVPEETWTASAFGLQDEPHAVAVRGVFG
ncbi:hypothetical protein ACIRPK_11180 [Kitasatospora sp. NPDC101801]|uniref:hypothetical protein n=1 Tax=Kitasatospora sp. NPDC101801 TaxID=3364103 RepID=UPI003823A8C6